MERSHFHALGHVSQGLFLFSILGCGDSITSKAAGTCYTLQATTFLQGEKPTAFPASAGSVW